MASHGEETTVNSGGEYDNGKVRLRKEMGLAHAVSVAMGVMIGCTIFLTPTSVSSHCGSVGLSLVVWGAAAGIMLLQAVCFTELAVTFPNAGGMYAYLSLILGDFPAFLYAWYFCVVCQPAFMAFVAMMTSNYLLMPFFPNCPLPVTAITIINVWIIGHVYLRLVQRTQTFLTAVKFVALVSIVIVGFIQLGQGRMEVLSQGFSGSNWDVGHLATAVYTCMTNYAGWEYLLMLTEEVKNPTKTIPRAIYISFAAVGTVFVLTNVAYFTVLSPAEMMATDTVAATFADKTMGKFSLAIPIIVVLSSVGALNAVIMGGSRVHFAAARDELFPSLLSMISINHHTPLPAVCMTCLLSSIWCLWGDPIGVIEYLGFTDVLFIGLTMSSLLYLKMTRPNLQSSYKVHIILPIISLLILGSLGFIGIIMNPVRNGIGLIPIVIGIPVYGLVYAGRGRFAHLQSGFDYTTSVLQKVLLVVPEED